MVVIVVVVEVPLIGVGAVLVDTVDVVVVELQPTPSDNRRTSLPVSAQATTRSRSPCVSDMSCTGVLSHKAKSNEIYNSRARGAR